jgi:excisionase family DNA binding protein
MDGDTQPLDTLLDSLAVALAPRLAPLLAERLLEHVELADSSPAGWMGSADAAAYLGLTRHALDKLCAARTIPFEQDKPGGKRWFQAADLDAWRRGLSNGR